MMYNVLFIVIGSLLIAYLTMLVFRDVQTRFFEHRWQCPYCSFSVESPQADVVSLVSEKHSKVHNLV